MDHKGRLQRLYADLDLPALNPAGHAIEVRQAQKSLSHLQEGESADVIVLPQTEPFEMATLVAAQEALPLLADPVPNDSGFSQTEQVEAAGPDGLMEVVNVAMLPLLADPASEVIALAQTEQVEVAQPVPQASVLDAATLPVVAERVPMPTAPQLATEARVADSGQRPLKANGTGQADWKALLIGVVTGTLVSGVIVLVTFPMNFFNTPGRLILWGGEMFLGIVGTLLANSWKSTTRELWRAAITWTLYPVWFALLIGLILLLLTFTSLTG